MVRKVRGFHLAVGLPGRESPKGEREEDQGQRRLPALAGAGR